MVGGRAEDTVRRFLPRHNVEPAWTSRASLRLQIRAWRARAAAGMLLKKYVASVAGVRLAMKSVATSAPPAPLLRRALRLLGPPRGAGAGPRGVGPGAVNAWVSEPAVLAVSAAARAPLRDAASPLPSTPILGRGTESASVEGVFFRPVCTIPPTSAERPLGTTPDIGLESTSWKMWEKWGSQVQSNNSSATTACSGLLCMLDRLGTLISSGMSAILYMGDDAKDVELRSPFSADTSTLCTPKDRKMV